MNDGLKLLFQYGLHCLYFQSSPIESQFLKTEDWCVWNTADMYIHNACRGVEPKVCTFQWHFAVSVNDCKSTFLASENLTLGSRKPRHREYF